MSVLLPAIKKDTNNKKVEFVEKMYVTYGDHKQHTGNAALFIVDFEGNKEGILVPQSDLEKIYTRLDGNLPKKYDFLKDQYYEAQLAIMSCRDFRARTRFSLENVPIT